MAEFGFTFHSVLYFGTNDCSVAEIFLIRSLKEAKSDLPNKA